MQLTHILLLLSLTTFIMASERTLISFKSIACENLAHSYHSQIFTAADEPKFYRNIGVLSVKTDVYKLMNTLMGSHEVHECVKEISEDLVIRLDDPQMDISEINADERKYWQLRRINVKNLPLPTTFKRFEVKGVPAHVYIIDSGIDGHHKDFVGKLAPADEHKSFTSDTCACKNEGPLCDCNSHGTHCAGLVASEEAGYNPNATLHSAKVFSSSGSTTGDIILQAMDWVIEAHKTFHPNELAVVSMSLGGGKSSIENQAVKRIHDAGMFITVAAGNSNKDSCTGSPSSAPEAFTVGASDIDDSRAYFSEFGPCVDIFAPGVQIWSTKPGNTYQYLSGTSMATPFIAGFASYVGTYLRTTDPDAIKAAINGHVSQHIVTNAKSANNNLPFDNLEEAQEHIREAVKFLRGFGMK